MGLCPPLTVMKVWVNEYWTFWTQIRALGFSSDPVALLVNQKGAVVAQGSPKCVHSPHILCRGFFYVPQIIVLRKIRPQLVLLQSQQGLCLFSNPAHFKHLISSLFMSLCLLLCVHTVYLPTHDNSSCIWWNGLFVKVCAIRYICLYGATCLWNFCYHRLTQLLFSEGSTTPNAALCYIWPLYHTVYQYWSEISAVKLLSINRVLCWWQDGEL